MHPFEILDPMEIPGWGQIPGAIIDDAITRAEWTLEIQGAQSALAYVPRLQEMAQQNTWRSEKAVNLALKIRRLATLPQQQEAKKGSLNDAGSSRPISLASRQTHLLISG